MTRIDDARRWAVLVAASLVIASPLEAGAAGDERPARGDRAASRTLVSSNTTPSEQAPPRAERTPPPLEVAPDQGVTPAGLPSWMVMLDMWPDPNDPQRVREAEAAVEAVLAATIGAGRAHQRYAHGLVGFAAGMTPAEAAIVAADPRVRVVEPDRLSRPVGNAAGGMPVGDNPNLPVPWNLRRISDPDGLAPTFDPCGATGAGVTAVVIDSGVALDHVEFAGRIVANVSFSMTEPPGGGPSDGHGTHVAGTFAGATVGVAPEAKIVSLKVEEADGGIFQSSWVAALNWTLVPGNVARPAVVNMSLGGPAIGPSLIREQILVLCTLNGVPVVVAAGNESHLALWSDPACSPFAITVGATDLADRPSPFSNHGSIVDIWAPGSSIVSADWQRPDGLVMKSGTSMAAPCVAGAVALFLEEHVTPEDLQDLPLAIPGRAAIWLARNAAIGRLADGDDPRVVSPGGNATLGGAANRLLQACTTETGIECDEPLEWFDGTASVVLGDGITPLGPDFTCERIVWNPAGRVALTVNWVAIPIDPATGFSAEVRIVDAATDVVLWTSDQLVPDGGFEGKIAALTRTVVSSSNAGLRVTWTPRGGGEVAGYGYTMTARTAAACPGDLDGDGSVNGTDLGLLFAAWGPCPIEAACPGDLNLDGVVGPEDLSALLGAWGVCPPFAPAPFVVGCNGQLLHKSFLGDLYIDCSSRGILVSPLIAPSTISIAAACCEATDFDAVPGNPVSGGLDTALGGCVRTDGSCAQETMIDCALAGGVFIGRGLGCDAMGPLLDADMLPCPDDAISTGWAIDWQDWGQSPVSVAIAGGDKPTLRWRQTMPPGVVSIGSLAFPAAINSWSSSKPNAPFLGPGAAYPVPKADVPFQVLIEFADGGDPIVVERAGRANPLISAAAPGLFGGHFLFTLEDVLAEGTREVASIEIGCYRDSVLSPSSQVVVAFAGRAAIEGEPLAEYSPDGGRTWLIGEIPVQLGLCIAP